MIDKPLCKMTSLELEATLVRARLARDSADFVEGLNDWRAALAAADERIREVHDEMAAREAGVTNGG